MMNTSYNSYRILNTYGAFGTVTRQRFEVVLQGTSSPEINEITTWIEYNFHCKPGDINRRPCIISPYHYRLDWLMWFSAFQSYQVSSTHCNQRQYWSIILYTAMSMAGAFGVEITEEWFLCDKTDIVEPVCRRCSSKIHTSRALRGKTYLYS